MKTLKFIAIIAVAGIGFLACKNETNPEVKTIEVSVADEATSENTPVINPNAHFAKAEFSIEGMTCAIGCAKSIEKKLAKMDGVKSASVDFDRSLAMVEYDDAMVTPASLSETVTEVADVYKVKDMKSVKDFSSEKQCSMGCCKGKTTVEKAECQKSCCANKTANSSK